MIVRCWGARGSIPVSGPEYIKYGGDTTCIEIRTKEDDIVIVDAGSGIRRLGIALLQEKRYDYSLFFTHGHWDHLIGFPFFKPIYFRSVNISMYGCTYVQSTVREMVSRVMAPPHFPVDYEDIRCNLYYHDICGEELNIKSLKVSSIPISHPNQGVGYRFEEDGKAFVFLTDNELSHVHEGGLPYEAYREFCQGADLLIHDAEFTAQDYKRTWGHSMVNDALRLAMEAGVKTIGLYHHNQERTDEGVEAILADGRTYLREQGVSLDCVAVHQNWEFRL
ncbi:MAG: MBL fold metallo-hydrolase [Syntrophales bacterium]|nr:MBL fold metallo-hydrolase [Syntrophales bacterium]